MLGWAVIAVFALAALGFVWGTGRAKRAAAGDLSSLHSRPAQHGIYVALWVGLAGLSVLIALALAGAWLADGQLTRAVAAAMPGAEPIRLIAAFNAVAGAAQGDSAAIAQAAANPALAGLVEARAAALNLRASVASGGGLLAALLALVVTLRRISAAFRARNLSERIIEWGLAACALIAIATTAGIALSLFGTTAKFFMADGIGGLFDRLSAFVFGTHWSPLSGVFDGKIETDKIGAVPLFAGTLLITLIAMLVAGPVGLFAAIYLSDYASPRGRAVYKPMLEILAGVPTVVYGFFAAITVAPFLRDYGEAAINGLLIFIPVAIVLGAVLQRIGDAGLGGRALETGAPLIAVGVAAAAAWAWLDARGPILDLSISSESALAAGVVMGIMIIPFISSLSDDVINAIPQSLRDGSMGLGATKAETMMKVVLPAALPGVVSAFLLGVSRAVGETMIVVMAAGQGANLTANPLEAVTTVTVQIVALITGDTEADTAAGPAFSLGFTLFLITLLFNIAAQRIVRKYRQVYD